ncbi:armadillo repeat-containing protein 1 [Ciona intestinalis]|uniref:armadillo repeat-containing protein 1 n=1 Tax=Ciona intestinalis TaxID=7719 RepID=UPI00005235BC|nr:armadillo repeat-containing protein 1 [Ciona intestinalis]|eukprot:XP_002125262.1 armadillo repeat-containing protein 1 [Ciona intestinalis]
MSTTSLSIVKELRRLAQNPAHREYLLRNDVNSILIFVDPDEHPVEVVSEALNALMFLAEEASESHMTRRAMKNTVGLMELMKKIEEREGYSVECKALSMKIQHLLINERSTPNSTPNSTKLHTADGVVTRAAGARANKKGGHQHKFLGGNKKAKVITLQINGLTDQDRRQQCVDELVRVKGVISLTFNMHLQRCTVRAKAELTAETLAGAVKNTKVMKASQVLKNADGQEILMPLESKVADTENKDLPAYLDEEPAESPTKDDKAVARPDSASAVGAFANSWFGSVITAVNKNLYW